jgi:phosphoribosylglycinamide formyltransferase-1
VSTPAVGVLVSGGGRTLENLAEHFAAGDPPARIALVLANKADAYALERARRLDLPAVVIPHQGFATRADFSRAVWSAVDARGCEVVVLAGFLRRLDVPERWLGRVLNIHPALLPAFGGKGFYGDRVHRAVLEAGVPLTGCTVHYVTNEVDAGPILLQREIDVRADDSVESLAARVFEEEKRALPEALALHFRSSPLGGPAR